MQHQYQHSYNSNSMNHRNDRSKHNRGYSNTNSHSSHSHSNNYNQQRPYQHNQHPNNSRTHTTNHSQYNRTNHNQRQHTRNHSNSNHINHNNHNTHTHHSHRSHNNPSLHSNPPRDNRTHNHNNTRTHRNTSNYNTSHPHPHQHNRDRHRSPNRNRDRNSHQSHNTTHHRNNQSDHHRRRNNNYNSHLHQPQAQRSRKVRNISTSHKYPPQIHNNKITVQPSIHSLDESEPKDNNTNTNLNNTNHIRNHYNISGLQTKQDTLTTAMTELSFDTIAYKYNYKSKINLSFQAAKCGQKTCDFNMDCTKIYPWKYTNEQEKKTKVRIYMLPCLKLLNNIQCMDEAIDFIYAPNDRYTNPDFFIDFNKCDKNMCFEWIENLLKSDYYETVDDFANDIRLIFNNIYKIFGYKHEWSKNARIVQMKFELKMINISRNIPNAKEIFIQNGNPSNDILQTKFLELDENKKQIDECLKKLEIKNNNNGSQEEKSNQMEVEDAVAVDDNNSNSEPVISKEKTALQKHLSNIDTSKIYARSRKRPVKQTLKRDPSVSNLLANNKAINVDIECEEGEIPIIDALDEKKLDMCDVWFRFIRRYNDVENLRRVVMIQEQFANTFEFDKYKKSLEDRGSELQINICDKSEQIQCKIYEILLNAKNGITKKKFNSLSVLEDMIQKKIKQREAQRDTRRRLQMEAEMANRNKKVIVDPYSNKTIEERRKREEEKKRQEMELALEKQKMNENMDEDSDDDFDDRIWMGDHSGGDGGHGHGHGHANKQDVKVVTNSNFNEVVLGKDEYGSESYRPIRPGNVDDVDIGMDDGKTNGNGIGSIGNMERGDSDDWKQYSWDREQVQHEEIDF